MRASLCLFVVLLLWSLSGSVVPVLGASSEEISCLNAFKSKFPSPYPDCYASWTGSDTCSWTGVGCNDAGAVTRLSLTQQGVAGDFSSADLSCLPMLEHLDLSSNSLTGEIPDLAAQVPNLNSLGLSHNTLEGSLELGFPNLVALYLSNNLLSGKFPDITNCPYLQIIDVGENANITGEFVEIGGGGEGAFTANPSLRKLVMSGTAITGPLPSFKDVVNLIELRVRGCALSGAFPAGAWQPWRTISLADLSGNSLSGDLSTFLEEDSGYTFGCQFLYLNSNVIEGELPSFKSMPSLISLDFSNNAMSGSIGLSHLTGLVSLNASWNQLSGSLSGVSSSALTDLDVSHNALSGQLPSFESAILIRLNVSHNGFTGSPPSLCADAFVGLMSADMSHNALSGQLPCINSPAMYTLDVSANALTGPVERDWLESTSMINYIDVSDNLLTGPLPYFMDRLALHYLDVRCNSLSGPLPEVYPGVNAWDIVMTESTACTQKNVFWCPPVGPDPCESGRGNVMRIKSSVASHGSMSVQVYGEGEAGRMVEGVTCSAHVPEIAASSTRPFIDEQTVSIAATVVSDDTVVCEHVLSGCADSVALAFEGTVFTAEKEISGTEDGACEDIEYTDANATTAGVGSSGGGTALSANMSVVLGVVGGAVGCALLAGGLFVLRRKKSAGEEEAAEEEEEN